MFASAGPANKRCNRRQNCVESNKGTDGNWISLNIASRPTNWQISFQDGITPGRCQCMCLCLVWCLIFPSTPFNTGNHEYTEMNVQYSNTVRSSNESTYPTFPYCTYPTYPTTRIVCTPTTTGTEAQVYEIITYFTFPSFTIGWQPRWEADPASKATYHYVEIRITPPQPSLFHPVFHVVIFPFMLLLPPFCFMTKLPGTHRATLPHGIQSFCRGLLARGRPHSRWKACGASLWTIQCSRLL